MKKLRGLILFCALIPVFSLNAFAADGEKDEAGKKDSPYDDRVDDPKNPWKNPFGIVLFRPNYVMPLYYTDKPYREVYEGATPDDQEISAYDFKFQISFLLPICRNLFIEDLSLDAAYTQVSYWQLYTRTQYFRETNYELEGFLHYMFTDWCSLSAGITHQSNGRGGSLERSWNRAYGNMIFSGKTWIIDLKGWAPVFRNISIDIHNPRIMNYMGYGRLLLAWKMKRVELSAQEYNFMESRFRRGSFLLGASFRVFTPYSVYVNYFNGYGQSLIEYDHRCQSLGVGIVLNDWI